MTDEYIDRDMYYFIPRNDLTVSNCSADDYVAEPLEDWIDGAHTRMRDLVTRELTSKVVAQMKPTIQQTIDDLIDAVQTKGQMDICQLGPSGAYERTQWFSVKSALGWLEERLVPTYSIA